MSPLFERIARVLAERYAEESARFNSYRADDCVHLVVQRDAEALADEFEGEAGFDRAAFLARITG